MNDDDFVLRQRGLIDLASSDDFDQDYDIEGEMFSRRRPKRSKPVCLECSSFYGHEVRHAVGDRCIESDVEHSDYED